MVVIEPLIGFLRLFAYPVIHSTYIPAQPGQLSLELIAECVTLLPHVQQVCLQARHLHVVVRQHEELIVEDLVRGLQLVVNNRFESILIFKGLIDPLL